MHIYEGKENAPELCNVLGRFWEVALPTVQPLKGNMAEQGEQVGHRYYPSNNLRVIWVDTYGRIVQLMASRLTGTTGSGGTNGLGTSTVIG